MHKGLLYSGTLGRRRAAPPGGSNLLVGITVQQDAPAGYIPFINGDVFGPGHAIWGATPDGGGGLIAYADAAMTTRLPLDVKDFDTSAKTCRLKQRLSGALTGGSGKFYLLAAGSGSQPATDEPFGRRSVYADFVEATEDQTVNLVDDSALSVTGTLSVAGPHGLAARGYGASYGVGSTDKAVSNYAGNPGAFSAASLCYRSVSGHGGNVVSKPHAGGSAYLMQLNSGAGGRCEMQRTYSDGLNTWVIDDGGSSVPVDEWFGMGAKQDGSNTAEPFFYPDGVEIPATYDLTKAGSLVTNSNAFMWGNGAAGSSAANLVLSETYLYEGQLPASWFAAFDANYDDPATFLTADAGVPV